jgi:hypothetical protein
MIASFLKLDAFLYNVQYSRYFNSLHFTINKLSGR